MEGEFDQRYHVASLLVETAISMARYEVESVTEIREKNGVRYESESRPSTESMVWSLSHLTVTRLIVKGVRKKAHFSNWDPISREVFANIAANIGRKGAIIA